MSRVAVRSNQDLRFIAELVGVVRCPDRRRDAAAHKARMLRDVASRCYELADALAAGGAQMADVCAWHFVSDRLPDDEMRVLIALDDDTTGEPAFGYRAGGKWYFDMLDTNCLEEPREAKVYAWAHVPALPALPAKPAKKKKGRRA